MDRPGIQNQANMNVVALQHAPGEINSASAAGSSKTLTPFPFLDLPPELRQHIYDLILDKKRYIDGLILNNYVSEKYHGLPAICRVCRQLRAEAFAIYLRNCWTFNFSISPRPNIKLIQRYIKDHNLRVDFWYHVRRVHFALRYPTHSTFEQKDGRLYSLLKAATNLNHLEITFPGWSILPSGSKVLCNMGDMEMLELLARRSNLKEVKITWTVNAPGWNYYHNYDDLAKQKESWKQAAEHMQRVFQEYSIVATVTPSLESADRRLWDSVGR